MSYPNRNEETHEVVANILKETEKAYLIIAKDIGGAEGFREFWIPKSQVSSQKASKKHTECVVLTLSDWIFNKMEPSGSNAHDDYSGFAKTAAPQKAIPGKRQYVLKPITKSPYNSPKIPKDPDLDVADDDDIPF